jgi:hypothetical protein
MFVLKSKSDLSNPKSLRLSPSFESGTKVFDLRFCSYISRFPQKVNGFNLTSVFFGSKSVATEGFSIIKSFYRRELPFYLYIKRLQHCADESAFRYNFPFFDVFVFENLLFRLCELSYQERKKIGIFYGVMVVPYIFMIILNIIPRNMRVKQSLKKSLILSAFIISQRNSHLWFPAVFMVKCENIWKNSREKYTVPETRK